MFSTSVILLVLASISPPDEIVLSTSGCYGRCPVMNVRLKSNGEVFFYGEGFTNKAGCYTGRITEKQFDEFLEQFLSANVLELERHYEVHYTDQETISTTFLRNDTIIQSINDYGRAAPVDLVQLYPGLRELYEKIELTSVNQPETDLFRPFTTAMFTKDGVQYDLLKSETFLLSVYLMSAKKVEEIPGHVYDYKFEPWLMLSKKDPARIVTDGRYFKVSFKKSPTVVYDIGFNFIKANVSFFEDQERHQRGR